MQSMRIPAVMIALSLLFYGIVGMLVAGATGAIITTLWMIIGAGVSALLGVGACFLVAAVFGTGFGEPKYAFIKLSAVILFAPAMGLLVGLVSPLIGAVLMIALFVALLQMFFQLELLELFAFVIALWLVQGAASFVVTAVKATITGG